MSWSVAGLSESPRSILKNPNHSYDYEPARAIVSAESLAAGAEYGYEGYEGAGMEQGVG